MPLPALSVRCPDAPAGLLPGLMHRRTNPLSGAGLFVYHYQSANEPASEAPSRPLRSPLHDWAAYRGSVRPGRPAVPFRMADGVIRHVPRLAGES